MGKISARHARVQVSGIQTTDGDMRRSKILDSRQLRAGMTLRSQRPAREPARGPRRLKVEATGQPIDVQNLAREIQAGTQAALHRLEVDLVQVHTATRNKLFFEFALALHLIGTALKLIDQRGEVALGDFRPAAISIRFRLV